MAAWRSTDGADVGQVWTGQLSAEKLLFEGRCNFFLRVRSNVLLNDRRDPLLNDSSDLLFDHNCHLLLNDSGDILVKGFNDFMLCDTLDLWTQCLTHL